MVDRQELQLNRAKQTLVDSRQAIAEQAKAEGQASTDRREVQRFRDRAASNVIA